MREERVGEGERGEEENGGGGKREWGEGEEMAEGSSRQGERWERDSREGKLKGYVRK